MSEGDFGETLRRVACGERLSAAQSAEAFGAIMRGEVSPARMASFLTALAMRKPGVDEIVGAVQAMRSAMHKVRGPEGTIDVCGTGGDGLGTLNVSTAVAFVVAACGVPVAKHGNRSVSSQTGAADVLEQLGLEVELDCARAEASLNENNFCFLFAPKYHAAMRHVAPVRRELGFRTIFNLIGPLSNPAGVRRQLVGVFSREWIEPVADVLRELGTKAAWVVHSDDGLDEISIAAPTHVAVLDDRAISFLTVTPEQGGLQRSALATAKGGDAKYNSKALLRLLQGEGESGYRDIVLLNAAAALVIAGKAEELRQGVEAAASAIASGRALAVLQNAIAIAKRAP